MLIKWEGKPGFLLTTTAVLVNIFAVVVSGIPSSVPTPTLMTNSGPTAESVVQGRRVPKQVGGVAATVATTTDHQGSETHHHHGHHGYMDHHGHGMGHGHHGYHGDGKYFQKMDAYLVKHGPGKYEAGHVEETPRGWEVRYERVDGNTKQGRVKWGDKYAGYGEHYWDYNHAGGHDDGHGHGHGHYSEPVPTYENQPTASSDKKVAMIHKRQSDGKKTKQDSSHGSKRISVEKTVVDSNPAEAREMPVLVLDRKTGQVIDTTTGNSYWLRSSAQAQAQHY